MKFIIDLLTMSTSLLAFLSVSINPPKIHIEPSRPQEYVKVKYEAIKAEKRALLEPSKVIEEPKMIEYSSKSRELNWAALRNCEGSYTSNTGNGYYGAYQFNLQTWQSVGGIGYPHQASPEEQDKRAQILYDQRGASPWPVCGKLL